MPSFFRNATLITMDTHHGAEPFTAVRLIADERIAGIGPQPTAPPDSEIIDAAGKLLMPGLINAHTHSAGRFFHAR